MAGIASLRRWRTSESGGGASMGTRVMYAIERPDFWAAACTRRSTSSTSALVGFPQRAKTAPSQSMIWQAIPTTPAFVQAAIEQLIRAQASGPIQGLLGRIVAPKLISVGARLTRPHSPPTPPARVY